MEEKIIVKDQWCEKYVKDNVWFGFGTIVNGWTNLKKNDPYYTLEQYKTDIKALYDLAITATISTYKIYERLEVEKGAKGTKSNISSPDIPIIIKI